MRKSLKAAALAVLAAAPAVAADDILSKAVNDPNVGWAPFGACAKADLYKDEKVTGGTAERMTISGKSANPWDCGAHIAIVKPLKQGDVLLLAFWARSETPPAGADAISVNANLQNDGPPYNSLGSAMLHIGGTWKMYYATAVTDKDYDAGKIGVQLQLATDAQVIDLGPLFILDFGPGYDRSKLPKS
jgi:hypothetical protein